MSAPLFKFFNENQQGRDFVVGDIHGMFSLLEYQLKKIKFNPKVDRIFSVGDLIDRGPESYRVIEFLDKPWFFSIMGNHESMLIKAKSNRQIYHNWIENHGGSWWEDMNAITQQKIFQRLNKLPVAFEISSNIGKVGIVHADIPVGLSWNKIIQSLNKDQEVKDYLMWSRNRYKYIKLTGETIAVEGVELIVIGHTPIEKPLHIENLYFIDTGATYINKKNMGHLTLLQIHPTLKVYQYPEPLS